MGKEDRQKDKYSPTKHYTEVSYIIWKYICISRTNVMILKD